jgi:hypothetical protein
VDVSHFDKQPDQGAVRAASVGHGERGALLEKKNAKSLPCLRLGIDAAERGGSNHVDVKEGMNR